jgi:hypothetical protein
MIEKIQYPAGPRASVALGVGDPRIYFLLITTIPVPILNNVTVNVNVLFSDGKGRVSSSLDVVRFLASKGVSATTAESGTLQLKLSTGIDPNLQLDGVDGRSRLAGVEETGQRMAHHHSSFA